MINKPKLIKITKDILRNLSIPDLIYVEISEPGAMGNSGRIMIYVIEKEKLICYETDWFDDREVYVKTGSTILRYQNEYENELFEVERIHEEEKLYFDYHYGGMGNRIFINKSISLIEDDKYFIYKTRNESYQIHCSVLGVFNSVSRSLKRKNNK